MVKHGFPYPYWSFIKCDTSWLSSSLSVAYLNGDIEGHLINWNLVREEHLTLDIS